MAYKSQPSFSTGELDPALHERTNFEKYKSGLATARNVMIAKTGRILSRMGRKFFVKTKTDAKVVASHFMSHIGKFLELGPTWMRIYDVDGTLDNDFANSMAIPTNYQIVDTDDENVVAISNGAFAIKLATGIVTGANYFLAANGLAPAYVSRTTTTGASYGVEYAWSFVIRGEETFPGNDEAQTTLLLPVGGTHVNTFTVGVDDIASYIGSSAAIDEIKFYRRPATGGSYGYIGSSVDISTSGTLDYETTFSDYGQEPDYTNQFIQTNTGNSGIAVFVGTKCGVMYQQRLVLGFANRIVTSRIGFPRNFTRSFPLSDDSSLTLTFGTNGVDLPRYMIESDGLILFSSQGVYTHTGALSTSNIALIKRGDWIIDADVPPLAVPGGVLFIDSSTNTVRQLKWSQETGVYAAEELSIFSDHLFSQKKVKSWAFMSGEFPLVWVTFTDGTMATLTYEPSQQMRAWTRHDSVKKVEYVGEITNFQAASTFFFQTKDGDERYYETAALRYPTPAQVIADPEADKNESVAALDAMVSWSHLINDDLTDDDMVLTPVVADTWDGDLTLSVTDDAIFPDPGIGAVGTIFKYFDSDRSEYELTVTARASDDSITVSPNILFPSTAATNPRLYEAVTTISGLTHLEGESISLIGDGAVLASPNNDIEAYTAVTVSSGVATLPASGYAAFIHAGRPYISDVETLDIDTIEQRPILIESETMNKVYLKLYKSRAFYIGGRFPATDTLIGTDANTLQAVELSDISRLAVDYENEEDILANRYDQPVTKRIEATLPGDWQSNGRISMRNVDPTHFEILSIIPDLEALRRSDRGTE